VNVLRSYPQKWRGRYFHINCVTLNNIGMRKSYNLHNKNFYEFLRQKIGYTYISLEKFAPLVKWEPNTQHIYTERMNCTLIGQQQQWFIMGSGWARNPFTSRGSRLSSRNILRHSSLGVSEASSMACSTLIPPRWELTTCPAWALKRKTAIGHSAAYFKLKQNLAKAFCRGNRLHDTV